MVIYLGIVCIQFVIYVDDMCFMTLYTLLGKTPMCPFSKDPLERTPGRNGVRLLSSPAQLVPPLFYDQPINNSLAVVRIGRK